MAKKSKKVEKETRRLMEGIADLVKKRGDRYKFKSKNKKTIKKVKRTCVHWIYRKGKEVPTVVQDHDHPGYWRCTICGASFPIKPLQLTQEQEQKNAENGKDKKKNAYEFATEDMLGLVNQMQFWSVKLGGDADDTKMFIRLKEMLPRFAKVSRQILKRVNQREEYEANRGRTDSMAQFNAYSGFNYRP